MEIRKFHVLTSRKVVAMIFDMVCNCGAALQVESDDYLEGVWLLITRFTDAHVKCGYMTELTRDSVGDRRTQKINLEEKNEQW